MRRHGPVPALKLLGDEAVEVHDPDGQGDRQQNADQEYGRAYAQQQLATFCFHEVAVV
jgi:hypothetical protein